MKLFFKELFEYGYHFNQQLGGVFDEHPDSISERAIDLYSHMLNAHQIWNKRIESLQPPFRVWQVHPIQDFKRIDKQNYEQSLAILDKFDFNETVHYADSSGRAFSNSVRDILFHIINHSTYHRGQIATEFKQSGITPLATDYIFYKR